MAADDTARIIYLVLLGVAIGGWFFTQGRQGLGKTAQQIAVWGLIFIGVIGAYGLWSDIERQALRQQANVSDQALEVTRQRNGHFYIRAKVNAVPVEFVVDTGATEIVLSKRDAERIGIDVENLAFIGRANTANGAVSTARITLDRIALGPFEDTDVRAVVNDGELFSSLLGMAYLGSFARIEIVGDRMILAR